MKKGRDTNGISQMTNHQHRPNWLSEIERTIAETAERHGRIALLFSGGVESCLLLHLAGPWRDRITVYTVRTGAEFPHMIAFIDRQLADWQHRVIPVDLALSFRELGLPASAVPIEHTSGSAFTIGINERPPRIVPWPFCCARNRAGPGYEAIKADGISVVIHGQRAGDFPVADPALLTYPALDLVAPLWTVPRADVMAVVADLGIELPTHYSEYPSSLDCSVCPSSLTTRRRTWMAQQYPEHLAVAEGLHADVRKAVIAALDADNTKSGYVTR